MEFVEEKDGVGDAETPVGLGKVKQSVGGSCSVLSPLTGEDRQEMDLLSETRGDKAADNSLLWSV